MALRDLIDHSPGRRSFLKGLAAGTAAALVSRPRILRLLRAQGNRQNRRRELKGRAPNLF